ncbi:unnamed protein product, partial [Mesorhabditis belari]|uniref:Methyltransferase domain-containing protein n=1 Tax=Mesorhabditis belari TaxID=2138241 RepID=A0AAF3ERI4_9BILA
MNDKLNTLVFQTESLVGLTSLINVICIHVDTSQCPSTKTYCRLLVDFSKTCTIDLISDPFTMICANDHGYVIDGNPQTVYLPECDSNFQDFTNETVHEMCEKELGRDYFTFYYNPKFDLFHYYQFKSSISFRYLEYSDPKTTFVLESVDVEQEGMTNIEMRATNSTWFMLPLSQRYLSYFNLHSLNDSCVFDLIIGHPPTTFHLDYSDRLLIRYRGNTEAISHPLEQHVYSFFAPENCHFHLMVNTTLIELIEMNFKDKLQVYCTGGVVSLAVALGEKLQLFKALDAVSSPPNPATAKQVAEKAHCKERYVKEWLSCLATADLIEVDEEERFSISDEKRQFLIDDPCAPFVRMQYITAFASAFDQLADLMKEVSPVLGLDYAHFDDYYRCRDVYTKSLYGKFLISRILPDVGKEIVDQMKSPGLLSLDVGCGSGFHSILMAQNFPSSTFTGIDISSSAIETAKNESRRLNLTNTEFHECNAEALPENWSEKFDFITIFDACHDQMRPDKSLQEIYRVLKKEGIFAMVEIDGTGNTMEDKKRDPEKACLYYGSSLFHCLPVGSNSSDALALGSMWGRKRAHHLLESVGFTNIQCKSLDYISNCLYLCTK